jgi:hypothetical protein
MLGFQSTWSVVMQNKKKIEAYYIGSFDDQVVLSPLGSLVITLILRTPFSPSLRSGGGVGRVEINLISIGSPIGQANLSPSGSPDWPFPALPLSHSKKEGKRGVSLITK